MTTLRKRVARFVPPGGARRAIAATFGACAVIAGTLTPAAALTEGVFPANDNFADAATVPAVPFEGSQSAERATREVGERESCGGLGGTVWYRLPASRARTLVIDTLDSEYDTVLAVYRGLSPSSLNHVACNDDWRSAQSRLVVSLQESVVYYIQVAAYGRTSLGGALYLSIEEAPIPPVNRPANDDFLAAAPIQLLPFTDEVDATDAGTEDGEPRPSCASNAFASVWYTYTPGSDGHIEADITAADRSTVVTMHTMREPWGLTEIACSQQWYGSGGRPAVAPVTAGKTIWIRAAGEWGDGGRMRLDVRSAVIPPPPANDHFADARVVDALPFTDTLDTSRATSEQGEPNCFGSLGASVWYSFTAPTGGRVGIDTFGSRFGTVLSVYIGDDLHSLELVDCTDNSYGSWNSRLDLDLEEGSTYWIQAGGYRGNTGELHLQVGEVRCDEHGREDGPASSIIHDHVEPQTKDSTRDQVHNLSCWASAYI